MKINVFHVKPPHRILCQGCLKTRPAIVYVTHDRKMVCKRCCLRLTNNPDAVEDAWSSMARNPVRDRPVNPPNGWYVTNSARWCLDYAGHFYSLFPAEDETGWTVSKRVGKTKFEVLGVIPSLADAKRWCESQIAAAVPAQL